MVCPFRQPFSSNISREVLYGDSYSSPHQNERATLLSLLLGVVDDEDEASGESDLSGVRQNVAVYENAV